MVVGSDSNMVETETSLIREERCSCVELVDILVELVGSCNSKEG